MSLLASAPAAPLLPRQAIDAKLVSMVSTAAVGLGVLLSGFVLREPAPYEIYMAVLIGIWALFGLRVSRTVAPLLVMFVLFNIGGMIAMTQMAKLENTPLYLAVSLFLALTSVFFASVVEARPALLRVIFLCWLATGVGTATFGVLGYFHAFPGAEIFTRYDRAAGGFEDPNVFGPFLALPAVYMLHQMLTGKVRMMPFYAVPLLILVAGIFFSFSRGAWGVFAFAAAMMVMALVISNRSGKFRLRILVMAVLAIGLLLLAIIVILQIPGVSEVFTSRARLEQDYDSARFGRFDRYIIGFQMATEHPLGIGALVFGRIYYEDTHDIWLKALLDYGWLGFACWLSMVLSTIVGGFRILFRDRPWRPFLLCAYFVFLGHVALGTIIDTDHWRHLYLLLGCMWGMLGATIDYEVRQKSLAALSQGQRTPSL